MTLIDPRASMALGLSARLNGGQAATLSETNWDVSGRCERPQRVTVEGRQYATHTFDPYWGWVRPAGFDLAGNMKWTAANTVRGHATHLEVRCGKCAPCLRARAFMWKERARTECERPETARTWFVTLTANPETQLRWSGEAVKRVREGGTVPTTLTPDEWYAERCKQAGQDLTKYVKRIRKYSGAKLRALWVFERHEGGGTHDGLPHIHGLLHEQRGGAPVKYRLLKAEWQHGFSTQKLLTDGDESERNRVSAYVSKCCGYIAKATTVRIRASRHYGEPQLPQLGSRADRIAAAAKGGGGVDDSASQQREEGTNHQRDAGLDLRASGHEVTDGAQPHCECRAPAVGGSAEGGGENLLPLQREALRDRREPEAREGRQKEPLPALQPRGPTPSMTAYARTKGE